MKNKLMRSVGPLLLSLLPALCLTLLLAPLAALSGCGQKGPLTLPAEAAKPASAAQDR